MELSKSPGERAGVTAYIALGANLGDRHENIFAALGHLATDCEMRIERTSSLIENPAVGGPADSPRFLNGVAKVSTTLPPQFLLARLLSIETAMGRQRRQRWEPRIIDLDLLLYGEQQIDEPGMTIPHPRMHQRRFVLAPLAEIAPDLIHPVLGKTIRALLDELPPGP